MGAETWLIFYKSAVFDYYYIVSWFLDLLLTFLSKIYSIIMQLNSSFHDCHQIYSPGQICYPLKSFFISEGNVENT